MNKTTTLQQTVKGTVMHVGNLTARIKVARTVIHPIYHKRYVRHSQFLAAVPATITVQKGMTVIAKRCRPLSKRKCWQVVSVS